VRARHFHHSWEIGRLALHWLRVTPLGNLVIDYETLVADPEAESRRLVQFLGLEWEPACLDFHRTQRPVLTASAWQIRQLLDRALAPLCPASEAIAGYVVGNRSPGIAIQPHHPPAVGFSLSN
jgi:hypothetical protein